MPDLTPIYTSGQLVAVSPQRVDLPADSLFIARIKGAFQTQRRIAGSSPVQHVTVVAYEAEFVVGRVETTTPMYVYQDEIIGYIILKPSDEE